MIHTTEVKNKQPEREKLAKEMAKYILKKAK